MQRFFEFHWHLIGNLGTDLLVIPLEPLFGLELTVKLIVICIPALTALGLILVSKEIHGSAPPTILFAVPFAYGYPFNFGFINFCLSMAFALLAFAYWLRLTRLGRFRLRSAVFLPLSSLIWITHVFGWAVMGLLAGSSELVRLRDCGHSWLKTGALAAINCLCLSIPLGLMAVWRSGDVGGSTSGYFGIASKTYSLAAALRDRWLLWDCFSVGVALVLIGSALFDRHLEISRRLGVPAAVLCVIFLLLPSTVFGSAYADMRLAPFMLMVALAAIRFPVDVSVGARSRMLALGLAFVTARLGGNTISFLMADRETKSDLQALDYIPEHARVLSLIGDACGVTWAMPRQSHLGSFVIARKLGFSNDQWQVPGAQLLTANYLPAGEFRADPSEVTYTRSCQLKTVASLPKAWRVGPTADETLKEFPRGAFDYVWLIHPSGFTPGPRAGLVPIWLRSGSMLYRVSHENRFTPSVETGGHSSFMEPVKSL